MATPVFWEGNIGSAPEHRSFPNGNNPPRQLLRLNVMFDNSIPDGQGGYKDRGGFWCSVEWWHQDAQRFAELFTKGMRVKVEGRAIMDRWPDKESGEEVQALKVEASRISILPHRLAEVTHTATTLPTLTGPAMRASPCPSCSITKKVASAASCMATRSPRRSFPKWWLPSPCRACAT